MMAQNLVTNVALLVTLSVLYSMLMRLWTRWPRLRQVVSGVLFGLVAIAAMCFPFHYRPGLIFDGRSVVLSIAGLFGGWPVALIAGALAAAFRLWLAGPGVIPGVGTVLVTTGLGLAYRRLRHQKVSDIPPLHLLLFGVVVHVAVLLLMFTLPWATAMDVLRTITLPFLTLLPLGNLVLGVLLGNEERRQRTEAALRESESRFRSVVEQSADGLAITDEQGRVTVWNRSMEEITGFAAEEMVGLPVWEMQFRLLPREQQTPERYQQLEAGLREFLRTGTAPWAGRPLERDHVRPDGTRVFVRGVVFSIRIDGGFLLASSARDFTAQREEQRRLEEREALIRSIFLAAPVGIGLVQERVLLDVNDTVCQMTGYTREELVGRDARILYPSDEDYDFVGREKYAQIAHSGLGTVETRWRRKDGTVIDVVLSSAPLDGRDAAKGVTFTALDISEQKRTAQERERLAAQVQEQARRLQQTIDTIPEGVLLLGPGHQVIVANPRAAGDLKMLADAQVGDRLTQLGGRPLAELLASPPMPGLWHELQAGSRTFELISRPIANGPEPEYYVMVINDVTREREVRAQQAQQERLATVGQLAAGIAHDFNNILAVILLYAQLVARTAQLTERDRERLATIVQQANRATQLIQQILDFGRRAMLERSPLDLLPLVKEQAKLFERTLPEHIRVQLEYASDDYTVNADPTRIQQVLMNLALNARDAMPAGGTLRIALERMRFETGAQRPLPHLPPGDWVKLTVADAGTGIPPDVLPRIFEPFFTTKGPGKGSGLGLPQVYGIVKQHEGEVEVKSRVGEGTTFTIYLPALQMPPAVVATAEVAAMPHGHGETVLVVEDGEAIRAALREAIEGLGYRVLEAEDGAAALRLMGERGREIGVVLSDVVMPTMGGMALLHALRERGWATPLILLTGHPLGERDFETLRAVGLSAWLNKPPEMADLARALAEALHAQSQA